MWDTIILVTDLYVRYYNTCKRLKYFCDSLKLIGSCGIISIFIDTGLATSNIKHVLEAAPHKQQLYGHLTPIRKLSKLSKPHMCDNIPTGQLPLSQPPKALLSSRGFSHLLLGVFHISLRTQRHNIHNREGGKKENKQTRIWVAPSTKRESLWHFPSILYFYEQLRACIRAEFPQSYQEH